MYFEEIKGDLVKQTKSNIIAHCISSDCGMGDGVVVPICKMIPPLKQSCKDYAALSSKINTNIIGTAYRFSYENHICYNMFTKKNYWDNAERNMTYDEYMSNLKSCLNDVKRQMLSNNEEKIAMPRIASGLDKCKWEDVRALIKDVFVDTDIKVYIYYLD